MRYVTTMPLTNAERQARYRERIKQLAARGVMSPIQAQLLSDARRHIREWRRSIAAFDEGHMRLFTNHVDTSADHARQLERLIVQNEALLAQYDPEGLTADGNVELGDIAPERSSDLWPERWVTYALDGIGRAAQLRTFDSEAAARADARRPGRKLGQVAADMWSIDPVPSRAIYAMVQEMPNGWWKGLVAGWSDLPEQYALSRERLLADLGQIAGEYASERLVRGIPIAASAPMTVKTWECVAIPFELPTAR